MAVTLTGLRRRRAARRIQHHVPRRITRPMLKRLNVRFSIYPTKITGVERDKIRAWLLTVLNDPQLVSGPPFPVPKTGLTMYIDGKAVSMHVGTWQIADGVIYLASPSIHVPPLDRVAILTTIARLVNLHDDPTVMETVSTALVHGIKDVVLPVWDGLVMMEERPNRFAFNLTTYQIAAELDGKWWEPSGQPAKVDDTWTVMEY